MYTAITSQTKEMEAKIKLYESIMRLTSANLRDLAISIGRFENRGNNAAACHDLADRLYNATIEK